MGIALLQVDDPLGAARAAAEPGAALLGGGTLVVRQINMGDPAIGTLVRLVDPRLRAIQFDDGSVTLGAAVTMSGIIGQPRLAAIAPAARSVGGPAIRNMATVGGNLHAESPYGDFTTALVALDASIRIARPDGEAVLSIADFLANRATLRACPIIDVRIPDLAVDFRFRKISRSRPKGLSVLAMAAVLRLGNGYVADARIAMGAAGPAPTRLPSVERALVGKPLDAGAVAAALVELPADIAPLDDAIASAWYRREVAPVHLRRFLLEAA